MLQFEVAAGRGGFIKTMHFLKSNVIWVLVFIIFGALGAYGQGAAAASTAAGSIKSIELTKFDIKQGVPFSPTQLDTMMTEIVDELVKLKKFDRVKSPLISAVSPTDGSTQTTEPLTDLVLSGTVTEFKPGNRATRYFIGFGAGKAKVVAAIKITERATGRVLLERNVDGRLVIGFFGGNTNVVTRGLAKEVAKEIKKAAI